MFGIKLL
jgi:hypothetical protein